MPTAPVLEIRSGFPWSVVDEFQDFVGLRNRAERVPDVSTLDFALSRPWRFKSHRFRAGIKVRHAVLDGFLSGNRYKR